jgi:hypothetical protein
VQRSGQESPRGEHPCASWQKNGHYWVVEKHDGAARIAEQLDPGEFLGSVVWSDATLAPGDWTCG